MKDSSWSAMLFVLSFAALMVAASLAHQMASTPVVPPEVMVIQRIVEVGGNIALLRTLGILVFLAGGLSLGLAFLGYHAHTRSES